MIRWLLQSTLCLILCPLLAAQQAAPPTASADAPQPFKPAPATDAPRPLPEFVTVPKDTKIKYQLLDSVSSATSKRGEIIRCIVAENVIVDGITVLPAGAIVSVIITKSKLAIPHKRDGNVDFRPANIEIGKNLKLLITDDVPESPELRKQFAHDRELEVLSAPLWIPLLPLLALAFSEGGGKPEKPEGKDFVFSPCFEMTFYVKSAKTIRVTDLPAAPAKAAAAPCRLNGTSARTAVAAP
jgi:hypothetical protein